MSDALHYVMHGLVWFRSQDPRRTFTVHIPSCATVRHLKQQISYISVYGLFVRAPFTHFFLCSPLPLLTSIRYQGTTFPPQSTVTGAFIASLANTLQAYNLDKRTSAGTPTLRFCLLLLLTTPFIHFSLCSSLKSAPSL